MKARWAFIGALLAVGCGSYAPTQATTETDAQALFLEKAHYYANVKGVRLDAVLFTDDLPAYNYMAWSVCNSYVIGVNKSELEKPWVYSYIPAFAAHEVCHIYYKDNLPCGRSPQVDIETRAEVCAREML